MSKVRLQSALAEVEHAREHLSRVADTVGIGTTTGRFAQHIVNHELEELHRDLRIIIDLTPEDIRRETDIPTRAA